jgi:N-acetylneuraminic acid mutarotase
MGGLAKVSPLEPLNDIYRYNQETDEWTRLKDLPLKGYAWVAQAVDDNFILLTGRADGNIHSGIWILDLRNSSMKEVGSLITSSTTAPLVKVGENRWWLIGGEPDANKNRTGVISVIRLYADKEVFHK